MQADAATKDKPGLIPSQKVSKRVLKRKKQNETQQEKQAAVVKFWRDEEAPQTLGCLRQSDPYLIATSGQSGPLFISPHSSDCKLWLL